MMSGDPLHDDFDALFELPLKTLPLSLQTTRILKWHHVASIGDCLLFYVRDAQNQAWRSQRFSLLMYGEVFQALVIRGYWDMLGSAAMWRQFALTARFGGPSVTWWQGKEQDLYEVPIEVLSLSIRPYNRLRRFGMRSLGDCIDFYWHLRLGSVSTRFPPADYDELEARLMTLDCWTLIAEQFDD